MTATDRSIELTTIAARAAADKLGTDVLALDVSDHLSITDVFLIVSASNERQVGAIVDGIEEVLLRIGVRPVRREGDREKRWVLLDYIDLVVHVQHNDERALYSLDRLWRDCPVIEIDLDGPLPPALPKPDQWTDETELAHEAEPTTDDVDDQAGTEGD